MVLTTAYGCCFGIAATSARVGIALSASTEPCIPAGEINETAASVKSQPHRLAAACTAPGGRVVETLFGYTLRHKFTPRTGGSHGRLLAYPAPSCQYPRHAGA